MRCATHEGGAGHQYPDFRIDQQNRSPSSHLPSLAGQTPDRVEVREVTRRVAVALRIKPVEAGRLVNSLRDLTLVIGDLPEVKRSPDPKDDFILALADAGAARYVVTGDKSGLLALRKHGGAEIVTAAQFVRRCLA